MKKCFLILMFITFSFVTQTNAQWERTNGPYGCFIKSIAISGINIFAGTYYDGIFLSASNGDSWTAKNSGLTNPPQSSTLNEDNLYVDTKGYGILREKVTELICVIESVSISEEQYCRGTSVSVDYTVSGTFSSSNTFTAQLSDNNGDFSNPVTIGSLVKDSSGTINSTIPFNTIPGNNYSIRVTSTTPQLISSVTVDNITILESPPKPSITDNNGILICISEYDKQWFKEGEMLEGETGTTFNPQSLGGIYTVQVSNINGCLSEMSNTFDFYTSAKITGAKISDLSVCHGEAVSVTFTVGGPFANDNVFSLELSDSYGSFNKVTTLDYITGASSKTFSFVFQSNILPGNKYKVRIRTTKPITLTSALIENIVINQVPGKPFVSLDGNQLQSSAGEGNQWFKNSVKIVDATGEFYDPNNVAGNYTVQVTNAAGCMSVMSEPYYYLVSPRVDIISISDNQLCQGESAIIGYTVNLNFNSNNIFTAELSDAGGDFSNASDIGSQASQTSGTIAIDIPESILAGNGYKIRISSSNPQTTSFTMNNNISILLKPEKPAITEMDGLLTSSADVGNQWYKDGSMLNNGTGKTFNTENISGNYTVQVTSAEGCQSEMSEIFNYLQTPEILTLSIADNQLCQGESSVINYFVSADFNSNNVFTAELSHATGHFLNPIEIGTVASPTSGTIAVTISENIYAGTNYKIRIVSTNPQKTSSANNGNIIIFETPDKPTITENNGILTSSAGSGNQWYKDGNILQLEWDVTLNTHQNAGQYSVQARSSEGCDSEMSEVFDYPPTGIIEEINELNFVIYPNPATDIVNLTFSTNSVNVQIQLIDCLGNVVYRSDYKTNDGLNSISIKPENISTGFYLIQVKDEKNMVSIPVMIVR